MHDQLQQLGLTKNEIAIYLFLLQHGISTPPQIAKGTGIARANCYAILQSLEQQHLISEQINGKRKAFIADDPSALFHRLQERTQMVENLLPDLRALHTTHEHKPTIRFYEGFDAVKEIYFMTLSSKEVFGIGSTHALEKLNAEFYRKWLHEVKKNGIVFHDILSHDSGASAAPAMKEALKGLYDFQLIPDRYSHFSTDILIWDNHIALLTLEKPIFGTVMTSAPLAAMFKVLFHVMWDGMRK